MDESRESHRSIRPAWVIPVAAILLVFGVTFLLLPHGGFWINDNGCKFIQMEGLIQGPDAGFAIPWPGEEIDPTYAYAPIGDPFAHLIAGRLYISFSPAFAWLSSLPYRLFGTSGLYLLPILGGLLTLPAVWRLAGLLPGRSLGQPLALIVVALGTPLWFYSFTFWEHTPAVCLGLWSVVASVRYRLAGNPRSLVHSAILCGLAVYLRDDFLILGLILAALPVIYGGRNWRASAGFLLVFLAALVPLAGFQWFAFGSPLGLHAASHSPFEAGAARYLAERWTVFRDLLLDNHPTFWLSAAITLPYLVLLLGNWSLTRRRFARLVPALSLFAALGGLFILAGHLGTGSPIAWLREANGLFAVSPILILAFVGHTDARGAAGPATREPGREPVRNMLRLIILLQLVGYLVLAPAIHVAGIHWGSRLLLLLYPLLGVLAASTVGTWWEISRHRRLFPGALIGLCIILAVVTQAYGLHLLQRRKSFSEEVNRAVARRPEATVVAIGWFVPQELAHSFYTRKIFLVRRNEDLDPLLGRLREAGETRTLMVTARPADRPATPGSMTIDDRLGFVAFDIRSVSLQAAQERH